MATTNALEKILRDVWADALSCDDLDVDSNFFDFGADSVLAARVFERLERVLGTRLPLASAAEHPTVREMALWIARAVPADARGRTLVRFEPARAGRTFFCVHGMGGHVLVFGRLARALAPLSGFAAFESVGRNDLTRADGTIEAMAERYLRDMRDVQPEGPYYLGGYSMGGVVAYEMARRLKDAGHEVGLVALLDSDLTAPGPGQLESRIIEFVSKALGLDPAVEMPYAYLDEAARVICERINQGRRRSLHLRRDEVVRFAEIYRLNASAARAYAVGPYAGRVAMFYTLQGSNSHMPSDTTPAQAAERLGWAKVVDAARLVPVPLPGDHWTMFGADVEHLAAQLGAELCRAFQDPVRP